jgi:predicted acetyltransferase
MAQASGKGPFMRRLVMGWLDLRRQCTKLGAGLVLLAMTVLSVPLVGSANAQTGAASAVPSLARYLPEQDLAIYWEFEGLEAHSTTWRKSAAYKLLNDTPFGSLLEDIVGQVIDLAQQSTPPDKRVASEEYLKLFKHGVQNGLAVGVFGEGERDIQVAVVIRNAKKASFEDQLQKMSASGGLGPDLKRADNQLSGRTLHPLGSDAVWWSEKDDIVLSGKAGAEKVLEVLDGKKPCAMSHPIRVSLTRIENGIEPVSVGFVDLSALPPLPPDAVKLGFDGIKRVEMKWGFQDEALMTLVRLVAPSPRRGTLGLLRS